MLKQYLDAGKIINTHGIRGEVKIEPWANSPDFLGTFRRFFIDGEQIDVLSSRVHKTFLIASLSGAGDVDSALRFKNKVISIDRSDAKLTEGEYFIQDVIGIKAFDAETGEDLGVIFDVITLPSNLVYVIHGKREILVPCVSEFIEKVDIEGGRVTVRLIEGM